MADSLKKVLLIGESGSGKSTLINMLGNYFLGGSLNDPPASMHIFVPTSNLSSTTDIVHNERNTADSTTSKTSAVQKYNWKSVSFIDTPGFADTNGPEQDDENVLRILEFASNEDTLSAVVIVVNGTNSRLVSTVRTVISRLRGNIPDVALNNIIFVMTNCSDRRSCNFSLSAMPFDPCAVVYMNNSAFSSHPATWSARDKQLLQRDWEDSYSVIRRLLSQIDSMDSFSTAQFRSMLTCRTNINGCLSRALTLLTELGKMEEQCLDTEANLQRHRTTMWQNNSYSNTKTVQKKVYERVSAAQRKKFNDAGIEHEYDEEIRCRTCGGFGQSFIGGCRYGGDCAGSGYESFRMARSVSETITEVNEQMKRLYETACADTATFEKLLATVQTAKARIKADMDSIADTVNQNCAQILPICGQFNFQEECEALLQQLRTAAVLETDYGRKSWLTALVRSLDEIAARANTGGQRAGAGARPCVHIEAAGE